MKPLFVFLLGVLVGWLIEWVIDFLYWRNRHASRVTEFTPITLEPATKAEMPAPTPVIVEPEPVIEEVIPDNLKIIKGIGPVIERKLNEAGIYTFGQLGNLTVDDLRNILGKTIQRLADEDDLLKQARKLAQQK